MCSYSPKQLHGDPWTTGARALRPDPELRSWFRQLTIGPTTLVGLPCYPQPPPQWVFRLYLCVALILSKYLLLTIFQKKLSAIRSQFFLRSTHTSVKVRRLFFFSGATELKQKVHRLFSFSGATKLKQRNCFTFGHSHRSCEHYSERILSCGKRIFP